MRGAEQGTVVLGGVSQLFDLYHAGSPSLADVTNPAFDPIVDDAFADFVALIDAGASEERPLAQVGIFDLIRAFQTVIARFDDSDAFREIVDERWTVSDKIDLLLKAVLPGGAVKFSSLFATASGKAEVIVTFLAVLELMKLNYFRVRQDSLLGEIELQRMENT